MNCVLTMASQSYQELSRLTLPKIQGYAAKIGADFIVLPGWGVICSNPGWEKFRIREFLEKYERVIWIGSDCIVMQNCPNLFDVVPPDTFGATDEWPLFHAPEFTSFPKKQCQFYGIPEYQPQQYFNSDVLVVSRCHSDLFWLPPTLCTDYYNEQTYLNVLLETRHIKTMDLGFRYNHIFMGHGNYPGSDDRMHSYIIHYTGASHEERIRTIKNDHYSS